jgi:hypothetical protein
MANAVAEDFHPAICNLKMMSADYSSRKGFDAERDPTRLKDSRSRLVACYVCGGTSLPDKTLATDPEPAWRLIVSCDYCALHWHLDCLSPPLATVPNLIGSRKWMCPNHAEQVMVSSKDRRYVYWA